MNWALIFGGIAVFALLLAAGLTVLLWHKLTDLWSEVRMLNTRVDEFTTTIGQLDLSPLSKSYADDV